MIQMLFYSPIDFVNGPHAQQNRQIILANAMRFFAAGGMLDSSEWGALTADQQELLIDAKNAVEAAHEERERHTATASALTANLVDRALDRARAEDSAIDDPFLMSDDNSVIMSMSAADPEDGDIVLSSEDGPIEGE
jgi:hypothetical protein